VPGQQIVRDFKSADTAYGLSALEDLNHLGVPAAPPALTAHSGSWCYPTDPVCQGTAANIVKYWRDCTHSSPFCPHFQYVSGGETSKAAAFLAPFLR
jgi:hypothetical protein